VNLKDGLGRDASQLYVIATTPGIVFRDLIIMGSRVAEGPGPSAPGHIRAYNIRSGQIDVDLSHHSASRRGWLRDVAS
jgi:quinoprotein glucose dehydrogenase